MSKHRLLNVKSLLLLLVCLLVNIGGAKLILWLKLPLFLDSLGTVLGAALGGYLPGVAAGFLANMVNGIADPVTYYYGILSVLIGLSASFLARRGAFTRLSSSLMAALLFAGIGGGLGSALTWMLYGFSFGSGISAPYAISLAALGLPEFWAQFLADLAIDVVDKVLTVLLALLILRLLPVSLKDALRPRNMTDPSADNTFHRKHSLRREVAAMIIICAAVLGTLATSISYVIYRNTMNDRFTSTASGVTQLVSAIVPADRIQGWLDEGVETEEYSQIENKLYQILDSMDEVQYLYVYQIKPDGVHVVFDLDTPELPGNDLGVVFPPDESFQPYMERLLSSREIEPVISNDTYGWLLTVYRPLYTADGSCAAYAAVDVSMEQVVTDRYVFIVKMASLLFGASMVIVALGLRFSERRLVTPINAMAVAAGRFAYESEEGRLKQGAAFDPCPIHTGDEIENLYHSLLKTANDVTSYIQLVQEKAQIIAQMQENTIISFADMVESRDKNTGEHVKKTAAYTEAIGEELLREGFQPQVLTENFVRTIVRSAPLHDIGKITISDTLLNKPGRLTPDEFELMKTHTTAGRDILQGVIAAIDDENYLATATDMATYHHEHWDGSGYPAGLKGEEIPLAARIMAVADVFDALLSKRSYKQPMDYAQAVAVIKEESGTHFDPAVVEAFLRVYDQPQPTPSAADAPAESQIEAATAPQQEADPQQ